MPVLVAPADRRLGALIVLRILREGGEVRAYCTGGPRGTADVGRLRAAGAVVATGDLDDEGRLEAAMAEAHSVVLLGPDPFRAPDDVAHSAALRAAVAAGVRRLIVTSVTGADLQAEDPLRRSAAAFEHQVADTPVPSVVLRLGLVDDELLAAVLPLLPTRRRAELADVPVAPLTASDVAELVAAFDAARSTAETGHVVFAAHGPRIRPLGDLLGRQTPDGLPFLAPTDVPLVQQALRGPWLEPDPGVFDAFGWTGVRPTRAT